MRVLTLIWMLVVVTTAAAAQKRPSTPSRPAVADPNSALAYYRMGMAKLGSDNQGAADALYWALELEPSWPEALYARRIAVLRSDPSDLVRYMRWDKKTRRALAAVDSGHFRALMQNPFVYRDLDRELVLDYYRAAIDENIRRRAGTQDIGPDLRYQIDNYLADLMRDDSDPETKAWIAFSERRFPEALRLYAKAIGKKHENPDAHEERATIFFLQQQYDSAQSELRHAIAEHKKKDDKERVVVYQPKAMLEFKLATVQLNQGKLEDAKEALGRSLAEDLSFYPAHLTLSNIALIEKDSAMAIRELGLAVELGPSDPRPLMSQAALSLELNNSDDAITSLTKVIQMKPLYATPHRLLGDAASRKGDKAAALAAYQKFLKLTVREDRSEAEVLKLVAELNR
jgi:tetratricopeptide (TPR) repeat protein